MNIEPNVIGNQPKKILTIPFETEKQLQKLTIRTLMKHPENAQKSQPNPSVKPNQTQEISQPKSAINFIEKPPTNP